MTRLGVLGWPVAHSRSPVMHNAALAALGLRDWHYQRLPVPPELFAETTRALEVAGFLGANVTIPHKEAALALADEPSDTAGAIGAANTLTFKDGTIVAENTDAPGLIEAMTRAWGGGGARSRCRPKRRVLGVAGARPQRSRARRRRQRARGGVGAGRCGRERGQRVESHARAGD